MIDYGPGLDATLKNLINLVQALPADKQAQAKCLCNQAILDGTTEAVAAELSALFSGGAAQPAAPAEQEAPEAAGDDGFVLEELQTPSASDSNELEGDDSQILSPDDSGMMPPADSGVVLHEFDDSDIVHGRCGSYPKNASIHEIPAD